MKYERGQLLSHIANPSQTIDEALATWMVETGAGRVHHGLIVRRDDNEVVLRDAQGAEHRIASDDVEWVEKQSQSLMPEHLLQSLTPMQAADLLAYLESLQ